MVSTQDFIRFGLCFVRVATFLAVMPLLNMRSVPIMAKTGLAALCSLIIMPSIDPLFNTESLAVLVLLALGEVAIGYLLAFIVILVFSIMSFAGHFVDTPIGFGMASVFDPSLGGQVPVFSQFYHVLAALVFLGLHAHLWLIQGVQNSFLVMPIGSTLTLEPSFRLMMELVSQTFLIGIQIALPILATILLTDIGLGIVIRAVPQINVFVLGFPIKISVGLVIVIFTLPAFVYLVSEIFAIDGLLFRYFQGLLTLGGS